MFKILGVSDEETFKLLVIERDGVRFHDVRAYPDFAQYDELVEGAEVEGYIRKKGIYESLVSYWKPERNWKPDESFY